MSVGLVYLLTHSRRYLLTPFIRCMHKIYQLLFLVGIGAGTVLSSCSRATYVFQPHAVTYRGDVAETTKRPTVAAASAGPAVRPQTVALPLAVPTAVASHPTGPGRRKKPEQLQGKIRALIARRVAASTVLTRAVKTLGPRQNAAEQVQPRSKARTFFLRAAAVLMAVGLLVFVATVAANPDLTTGIILLTIALASFGAGLVLLTVGLLQKG